MEAVVKRCLLPVVLSVLLLTVICIPLAADVAYIIKKPSGDRDVSIIFSYDPEAEAVILDKVNEDGHILQWQIQCANKYVFYRPFEFTQGRFSVRPVLCLVTDRAAARRCWPPECRARLPAPGRGWR